MSMGIMWVGSLEWERSDCKLGRQCGSDNMIVWVVDLSIGDSKVGGSD